MTINPEAVQLLNAAKADGRFKVFNGAAKYKFLMNMHFEPVPLTNVTEAFAGPKGTPLKYGSMCKVNDSDPEVGGMFPFAHKAKDKFKSNTSQGAYVGLYEAIEDILDSNGVKKVSKGDLNKRVAFI